MSQIEDTENALLALLGDCQLPAEISIDSAPNAWSGNYVRELLTSTPAVRLAFLGAEPYSEQLTTLNLKARWGVYVVVGWSAADQSQRRLGADAGYDLVSRVAPILHRAPLKDPAGLALPFPEVNGIEVITDAPMDAAHLWVAEILIEIELPLDIPEPCQGPLDDWLRFRATIDLPGGEPLPDIGDAGTAGDVPLQVDLPQT